MGFVFFLVSSSSSRLTSTLEVHWNPSCHLSKIVYSLNKIRKML